MMKKSITLLFLLLLVCSCGSDVEFNSPGFQARKDNYNWKAKYTTAKIINGKIIIEAGVGLEQVTLTVVAPLSTIFKNNPVIHKFGITAAQPVNENEATYKNTVEGMTRIFKTNTMQSNGQLEITSFDFTSRKLSGKFRFNATSENTSAVVLPINMPVLNPFNVNFQEGFIFDVEVN